MDVYRSSDSLLLGFKWASSRIRIGSPFDAYESAIGVLLPFGLLLDSLLAAYAGSAPLLDLSPISYWTSAEHLLDF